MSYTQTVFPYDTVVYITDVIGSYTFQGSGVLIAPDEVLTASHVVYSSDLGAASDIVVTPAYGGAGAPYGSSGDIDYHYNDISNPNDTISNQQSQYDYALIHLSQSFGSLGTMGLAPGFTGGGVSVTGYPAVANGAQVTSQQTVSLSPSYSVLDGTALGDGSSGGPVWIQGAGGPEVVGLVSSADGGPGSAGFDVQITTAAYNQIEAWMTQDHASPGAALAVYDVSSSQALPAASTPYTGPVAGLQSQFIDITPDNLNVTASTNNWFIHTGSGTDAIAVTGGSNVLDGGTGSNFLSGGSGDDTFFVDDREATADIWSTVANFHAGDSATIWGVTPNQFALDWVDGQGASGYTGLTLHAVESGYPTASLTLAGYQSGDLSSGRLSVTYGTDSASGSAYMFVHANS